MKVDRWPPMLGVVGFDGGTRPAVSLAIPPSEAPSAETFVQPETPCGCITALFENVVFDCGCVHTDLNGDFELTDVGNFNGVEFDTITGQDTFDDCASCKREPAFLIFSPSVRYTPYTPDCSGSPGVTSDAQLIDTVVAQISGIWYVACRYLDRLIFFGSTADTTSPITNDLNACDSTPTLMDNDFSRCYSIGPRRWDTIPFVQVAHGGTVSLGQATPCGACCDPLCELVTPDVCAFFGGTYQGDGTSCDPNPC